MRQTGSSAPLPAWVPCVQHLFFTSCSGGWFFVRTRSLVSKMQEMAMGEFGFVKDGILRVWEPWDYSGSRQSPKVCLVLWGLAPSRSAFPLFSGAVDACCLTKRVQGFPFFFPYLTLSFLCHHQSNGRDELLSGTAPIMTSHNPKHSNIPESANRLSPAA